MRVLSRLFFLMSIFTVHCVGAAVPDSTGLLPLVNEGTCGAEQRKYVEAWWQGLSDFYGNNPAKIATQIKKAFVEYYTSKPSETGRPYDTAVDTSVDYGLLLGPEASITESLDCCFLPITESLCLDLYKTATSVDEGALAFFWKFLDCIDPNDINFWEQFFYKQPKAFCKLISDLSTRILQQGIGVCRPDERLLRFSEQALLVHIFLVVAPLQYRVSIARMIAEREA